MFLQSQYNRYEKTSKKNPFIPISEKKDWQSPHLDIQENKKEATH